MAPRIFWTAPNGARDVVCAVFTCEPIFRNRLDDAVTPEGERIQDIYNFNACVLSRSVSGAELGSVTLTTRMRPLPDVEACTADGQGLTRTIESLSIGCWAYDDHHVVAVSDLTEIEPSFLKPAFPSLPSDAACMTDGKECYDPDRRYFGLCVNNACQLHCAPGRAQDCQFAALKFYDEPLDAPCGWACDPVPRSLTGVCRRL